MDIDWSKTRGAWFGVSVGAASGMVLAASETRVGLMMTGPQTGRITLSTVNPAVLDQGITLSSSMGVIEIWYEYMGNAVKVPLWGIADAGGRILGVIETLAN